MIDKRKSRCEKSINNPQLQYFPSFHLYVILKMNQLLQGLRSRIDVPTHLHPAAQRSILHSVCAATRAARERPDIFPLTRVAVGGGVGG